MKLLVVESNTKAKTLQRILGKNYQILASVGHIYELADKKDAVDIDHDFKIKYRLMSRSTAYVKAILASAKQAEMIFLATDPDREGEIIAWHLNEEITGQGIDQKHIKRVTFQEITGDAVRGSLLNSRDIDMDLVQAQQSRVILDYLIGFNLSPVLWRKLPGAKSAGRVQSAVLRLICEREIERNKFSSQEYWSINCNLQSSNADHRIMTAVIVVDDKKLSKFDLKTKEQVSGISKDLQKAGFTCTEIKDTSKNLKPKPPLITSTLQQVVFNKYNINTSQIMKIAQQLYEGVSIDGTFRGLITYMRTDSVRMSQEFIESVRQYVTAEFSSDYVPAKAITHKQSNKLSQEAHECIRPTDIDMHPDKIKAYLTEEQYKVYSLIWKYSVASQMSNAVVHSRHILFQHNSQKIVCRGHIQELHFDGFMRLMNHESESYSESNWIKQIKKGDSFTCIEVKTNQHFTEPSPRYTEGSLIKTMESYGIGRPSTYAHIIDIIKKRQYIDVAKNALVPSRLGLAVTVFLCSLFRDYTDYNFTATMEDNLDKIASGTLNRSKFLAEFWKFFFPQIQEVMKKNYKEINNIVSEYLTQHDILQDNKTCDKCGSKMMFCIIRGNLLYSCTKYPDCKHCVQLFGEEQYQEKVNDQALWQDREGDVYLRVGPYGHYLSMESTELEKTTKIKTVAIPNSYCNLDLDILRIIMTCPAELGRDSDNEAVNLCCGRYGLYLKYKGQNFTIRQVQSLPSLDLPKALDIINTYQSKPRYKGKTKSK